MLTCNCGHKVSSTSATFQGPGLSSWSCTTCGFLWEAGERFMPHLRHPRLDAVMDRLLPLLTGGAVGMIGTLILR